VHLFTSSQFPPTASDEDIKYEQGEPMTAKSLMTCMLSHWEILKNKAEWEAPGQEGEQFMIVKVELEELKQKKLEQGLHSNLLKKISEEMKQGRNSKQAGKHKGKKYQEDPAKRNQACLQ
jgi:hypothetical protein